MEASALLVDTHAHLNAEEFDKDREAVIGRAVAAGVGAIIDIGSDLDSCRKSVALARRPGLYATVGIHPHSARHMAKWVGEIETLAASPGVVAIGEIGLDYYRNLSEPSAQRDCFTHFLGLARSLGLPVVVHDRDAHDDVVDLLRLEHAGDTGGVMHCFSGDVEMAKKCLDMGFYISLAGPVTFRNNARAQQVVRMVPDSRLLLETDCPYLTPEPYRGMRNEPGMVRVIAERASALKGVPPARVVDATGANAQRLFGLNRGRRLVAANLER
jgi:TatD DNase family protein